MEAIVWGKSLQAVQCVSGAAGGSSLYVTGTLVFFAQSAMDYYATLEVNRGAGEAEINKAYAIVLSLVHSTVNVLRFLHACH